MKWIKAVHRGAPPRESLDSVDTSDSLLHELTPPQSQQTLTHDCEHKVVAFRHDSAIVASEVEPRSEEQSRDLLGGDTTDVDNKNKVRCQRRA
jgi:hypothetical protein